MDLSTEYLGLKLTNPLVVSPSPLSESLENIKRMEDAGAGAIVLHSLFEEQIGLESEKLDRDLSYAEERSPEAVTHFPDLPNYKIGPEAYLDHIRRAKQAVRIPVIGSLNGVSNGGWLEYAKLIEAAGADALELNVYYVPTSIEMTGAEVEEKYVELAAKVKSSVRIPVAVKIGPFFSSVANLAKRLEQTGADGLVLFNRFYQPDFDLEVLEVVPNLHLSTSHEFQLRLTWVAILYGHIKADMAITGGVHTAQDVLKAMMAGAKVAMTTSALLRNGIAHLTTVKDELVRWMDEHEYSSIRQMRGSMSQKSVADPAAFVRANYMKTLSAYALRISPN